MTFMTARMPAPVLRSTDHVLASIPFLLGFHPQESAVLMWLRQGTLVLTQRVDLPKFPIDSNGKAVLQRWVNDAIQSASHADAQEVLIVVVPAIPNHTPDEGLSKSLRCNPALFAPIFVALSHSLVALGKYPCGAWLVVEDEYLEFNFAAECFPADCRSVDPQVIDEIREDFMSAGWRHLENRHQVVCELLADQTEQRKMLGEISAQTTVVAPGQEDEHRDDCIRIIVDHLTAGALDSGAQAQLITGLLDIRVRDCVLWHLTRQDHLASSADAFLATLRAAPDGLRAPVAAVAAIAFWVQGDGVRATAAVNQALSDDPDYGLAHLVQVALTNGLTPAMWRETMGKLSYDVCRSGVASQLQ